MLPQEAFYETMRLLRGALPPPADDDPVSWVRRDRAAMAGVVAFQPANAAEAQLAAQYVVANFCAMDCLRLAQVNRAEFAVARQCTAQAMGMMRESKSASRRLERMQAVRRALAKDEEAADMAMWAEHATAAMMAEALVDPVAEAASAGQGAQANEDAPAGADIVPEHVWKSGRRSAQAINAAETSLETDAGFRRTGTAAWPPQGQLAS